MASLEDALRRFPASVSLHLLGPRRLSIQRSRPGRRRRAGRDRAAGPERRRGGMPRAEGLVTLGRFFLLRGADARKVLDQFYDVVTKQQPDFVEAYLATAELALDKEDYALAAETLRKAPKDAALDPRFHYLLAVPSRPRIAPGPPRSWPRRSRSTRATSTACCSRPTS